MKAKIQEVTYLKERTTPFGTLYSFRIKYDDRTAIYQGKDRNQTKFVTGKETEFTEEEKSYTDAKGATQTYMVVKPVSSYGRQSNFGKALEREKSKYSGFAVSYAKDLVAGGRLPLEQLESKAWELFNLMVKMDKSLEQ